MSKVVAVRLLTGEEVVGVLLPSDANSIGLLNKTIKLKNPALILVTPPRAPNQAPQIGLAPFMPYFTFASDTVEFKEDHIVFQGGVDSRIEEGYRKANKMPIGTSTPGLIVP